MCIGFGQHVKPSDVEECKWFTLDEAVKNVGSEEAKNTISYYAEKNRTGDMRILDTNINLG